MPMPYQLDQMVVYMFQQSNSKNYLFVYKNFEKVNTIIAPAVNFERISRFLSISPDGYTLLDVDDNGIKKYSIDNGIITYKFQSMIQDHIDLFRTDWSNSRIFIKRQIELLSCGIHKRSIQSVRMICQHQNLMHLI